MCGRKSSSKNKGSAPLVAAASIPLDCHEQFSHLRKQAQTILDMYKRNQNNQKASNDSTTAVAALEPIPRSAGIVLVKVKVPLNVSSFKNVRFAEQLP